MIANIGVVGKCKLVALPGVYFVEKPHNRLRLLDRQRTHQEVEDTEKRSVHTNPKRERRDNDDGEARSLQ